MLARLTAGTAAAAIGLLAVIPAAQAQSRSSARSASAYAPTGRSTPPSQPSPAASPSGSASPAAQPSPPPEPSEPAPATSPGRPAGGLGIHRRVVNLRRAYQAALPHARARRIGGVVYARGHHRPLGRTALTGWAAHLVSGAGTTASATTPLSYHGGPVQHTPHVYLLLWGPAWSGTEAASAAYLSDFYAGLGDQPDDNWSGTTSQYGDTAGNPAFPQSVDMGTWYDTSTPPFGATQSQIAAEADAFAAGQGITDLADAQIVVATQSGTCPQGFAGSSCPSGGAYCAWHSYSKEPYTNLPYQPDAGASCGANAVRSADDGFSIVGGHEYAETVTDPYISAWTDSSGDEIGDKCAWTGLGAVALKTGTFAVQPLFSNISLAASGQGCVLSAGEVADPSVLTGPDGDVRVFARQAGLAMGDWNFGPSLATSSLGGDWPSPQAALTDSSGVMRVYGIGTTGDLYEAHKSNGGAWSAWYNLGTPGSALRGVPAVVQDHSGTIRVYARAVNGGLYEVRLPSGGTWSSWWGMGGDWPDNPAALVDSGGVVRVYATGTTGNLYEKHLDPGGSWSSTWYDLGGALRGAPSAVQDQSGTIRVYDRGTDGALYEVHLPAGGAWSPWYDMGGNWPSNLTALVDSSGVVRVYGAGTTGDLYEKHLNLGAAWSGWYDIGHGFEGTPAAVDANGTVEVYARGTNQQLTEAYLAPGSPWSLAEWGGPLY